MTFHDSPTDIPDPEVVPKAKRRTFSDEYKRRILEEVDNCAEPGQVGTSLAPRRAVLVPPVDLVTTERATGSRLP